MSTRGSDSTLVLLKHSKPKVEDTIKRHPVQRYLDSMEKLKQSDNPITGTEFTTPRPSSSTPEMTEEEKEAEMDKLLVLFDRLERVGPGPGPGPRPKVKVKG
uniref:Uncharacterized protein n=1 Tax=Moniliophthora roreri TaxID=221103 RepID=A0A0W0G5N2_MONRR